MCHSLEERRFLLKITLFKFTFKTKKIKNKILNFKQLMFQFIFFLKFDALHFTK